MLKVKVTLKSGREVVGEMKREVFYSLNDYYWITVGNTIIQVDCIEMIEVIGND